MIPKEYEAQFLSSLRSPSVPFVINDAVHVVAGQHSGKAGSVIAMAALEPELVLLVELGDGTDVELPASQLKLGATR